jgi:hypothetical protein
MLQMNLVRFEEVANEAILRARQAPKDAQRWERAIVKAFEFLSSTGLWHLMDDDQLVIVSPQSGHIYEVGERCEVIDGEKRYFCAAFDRGQPCWHRAAKRLVGLIAAEPIQID